MSHFQWTGVLPHRLYLHIICYYSYLIITIRGVSSYIISYDRCIGVQMHYIINIKCFMIWFYPVSIHVLILSSHNISGSLHFLYFHTMLSVFVKYLWYGTCYFYTSLFRTVHWDVFELLGRRLLMFHQRERSASSEALLSTVAREL